MGSTGIYCVQLLTKVSHLVGRHARCLLNIGHRIGKLYISLEKLPHLSGNQVIGTIYRYITGKSLGGFLNHTALVFHILGNGLDTAVYLTHLGGSVDIFLRASLYSGYALLQFLCRNLQLVKAGGMELVVQEIVHVFDFRSRTVGIDLRFPQFFINLFQFLRVAVF